jgi:hypothetical protein
MKVNAVQAPKQVMQELTRQRVEGKPKSMGNTSERFPSVLPGEGRGLGCGVNPKIETGS